MPTLLCSVLAEEALNEIVDRSDNGPDIDKHMLDHTFLHNVYVPDAKAKMMLESRNLRRKKAYYMKPYSNSLYNMIENSVISLMMRNGHEHLLKHPMVKLMLSKKWEMFGRWRFFAGFLAQILFVCLLMTAVLLQPHPSVIKQANELLANTTDDDDCTDANMSCCRAYRRIYRDGNFDGFIIVEGIVTAMIIINLINEIARVFRFRKYFFTNLEDIVTVACCILILCLVVNIKQEYVPRACLPDLPENESSKVVILEFWQWQVGTIGVMLAWICLLFYLRKLPHFGIYVIMFFDIAKTFVKFGAVFVVFLLSFASAFYMLFPHNQCPFDNVFTTIIKTFTMTLGEIEFGDIMCSRKLSSPYLTWIVVLVLAFVMSLVVMNLMVGLAVQDIKAVQDKAVFKKLCLKASVVMGSEYSIPYFMRKHMMHFEISVTCDELGCGSVDDPPPVKEDEENKSRADDDKELLFAQLDDMRGRLESIEKMVTAKQNDDNNQKVGNKSISNDHANHVSFVSV